MSVILTEAAADRVKGFLATQADSVGLRLGVKPSGCSGFAYVVDLTEAIEPEDEVYESCGVKVIVDKEAIPIVAGTTIDFKRAGLNEGFTYENPNVTSECGCGESFGV
ncbi:MAG: iron-sulfur cluster assembly accessory protein [Gammaproteobacteria bacterium]|nr:iron-sulfur cluster assembly accessory protein [Gammaproteobacteria bacterium]